MIVDAFSARPRPSAWASRSSTAGGTRRATAKFVLGENTRVHHRGRPGRRARLGRDRAGGRRRVPRRSATTRTRRRRRPPSSCSRASATPCPGDFAEVEADGSLTLLGRGSVCINTGGEKVFPEEVEEVLKTHPACADAVAVGVPDEQVRRGHHRRRRGRARRRRSTSAGAHRPREGEAGVVQGARSTCVAVDTIGRAPNGKVDYKRLKAEATLHADCRAGLGGTRNRASH